MELRHLLPCYSDLMSQLLPSQIFIILLSDSNLFPLFLELLDDLHIIL
jgi:hypothetical protein